MSIFLNYEGIKGEASDSGHKDWVDLEDLQWGISRSITSSTSTQGDRESSNAVISDLIVTRRMDSATPKFFIESCCGTGKDVTIHLTKTGTGSGTDTYMEYKLKNALISNYKVISNSQDIERPTEEIKISFIDIDVKYTPYDEDGNAESPIAVGFDTATNTKR